MKKHGRLKKRKGAALAWVLIMMVVVGILAISMSAIFTSNLKQTKYQQDSLEAYYLAYSGALVAYEALLANNNQKLYILTGGGNLPSEEMTFDNGKSTVTAVVSTDTNFENLIKIVSIGKLSRNNFEYTRTMYFDPANPLDILWKSN